MYKTFHHSDFALTPRHKNPKKNREISKVGFCSQRRYADHRLRGATCGRSAVVQVATVYWPPSLERIAQHRRSYEPPSKAANHSPRRSQPCWSTTPVNTHGFSVGFDVWRFVRVRLHASDCSRRGKAIADHCPIHVRSQFRENTNRKDKPEAQVKE